MLATDAPELVLDEENHIYYLGKDEIPGVTRVLTALGFFDVSFVTPEALYRGRYVHAVLHYLNDGDFNLKDCLPQFRGFVESWLKFVQRMGPRLIIIKAEYRDYDRLRLFAGTVDLWCKIDDWEWIIDYKTVGKGCSAPKAAKFQTGAYSHILPPWPAANFTRIRKRACLELFEDGAMANLVPHNDFDDAAHFLCFLDTYNQRRLHGIRNRAE